MHAREESGPPQSDVAIATYAAICALIFGMLAYGFYKIMEPVRLPNSGLLAYKPPPATVLNYSPAALSDVTQTVTSPAAGEPSDAPVEAAETAVQKPALAGFDRHGCGSSCAQVAGSEAEAKKSLDRGNTSPEQKCSEQFRSHIPRIRSRPVAAVPARHGSLDVHACASGRGGRRGIPDGRTGNGIGTLLRCADRCYEAGSECTEDSLSWKSSHWGPLLRGAGRRNRSTGTVWQNPIIEAPSPAQIRCAWVRFEPRARTAWHTHPLGQTLHVVSGVGRVQLLGGPGARDPRRGHGLDCAGGKALAWRRSRYRHGAPRHAGASRRQACHVVRTRHRRTI